MPTPSLQQLRSFARLTRDKLYHQARKAWHFPSHALFLATIANTFSSLPASFIQVPAIEVISIAMLMITAAALIMSFYALGEDNARALRPSKPALAWANICASRALSLLFMLDISNSANGLVSVFQGGPGLHFDLATIDIPTQIVLGTFCAVCMLILVGSWEHIRTNARRAIKLQSTCNPETQPVTADQLVKAYIQTHTLSANPSSVSEDAALTAQGHSEFGLVPD